MKYHYQDPDGNYATCVTSNPAHMAIMEKALLEDCELENPADEGKPISDVDKDKLTSDKIDALKILKIEYHGNMHTVMKKVPEFNPNSQVVN